MIPIQDAGPGLRGQGFFTVLLLSINSLLFLVTRMEGGYQFERTTVQYGAVPANVTGATDVRWVFVIATPPRRPYDAFLERYELPPEMSDEDGRAWAALRATRGGLVPRRAEVVEQPLSPWVTLVTSMFLHGGWLHLIGNMVFLLVFGRRLEARLGAGKFVLFYFLTGIAAGLSHVAVSPEETLPMVGASGAISGLLGAYVMLWPQGRILTVVPIVFLFTLAVLPALLFVAIWMVMQVLIIVKGGSDGGGIAVWAHLGGFAYGLATIKLVDSGPGRPGPPPNELPYVRRPEQW